ncbi:hypothetical protein EcWSU1_02271 [Enterobacter ludwigii]|uniref:Uncharacterized protein n=1 Tax=Enterobacter ludwigii TaxID=299767 RepID=G8LQ58_9ENTR|nr:hypothetical protein EcWSU1_02271 [Enterobacter ludwigii]
MRSFELICFSVRLSAASFLNIIAADDAAIAGVTLDADAKPFRNFLCHCSGVLMLGFRVGFSFPTLTRISHRLRSD